MYRPFRENVEIVYRPSETKPIPMQPAEPIK